MLVVRAGVWLTLSCAAATPLAAQRSTPLVRGTWVASGTAGYTRSRDLGNHLVSTTLNLQPSILYFVTPRLAVGGYPRPDPLRR
jgi:hypothetical protein